MRAGVFSLAMILVAGPLSAAANAQSPEPEGPISALFGAVASPQPMQQDVRHWREDVRVVRYGRHRLLHAVRRPAAKDPRTIRAKAEVTIIDRDHIVIKLTRRGIGAGGGPSASSR